MVTVRPSTTGAGQSVAYTVTVAAQSTSQALAHNLGSSNVSATPTTIPHCFWKLVIDDANNITMHLAQESMTTNVVFEVIVS